MFMRQRGLNEKSFLCNFLKNIFNLFNRFLSVVTLLLLATAQASERGIQETARRSGYSIEDVREFHEEGCDTGSATLMNICVLYGYVENDLQLNDTYQELMSLLKRPAVKVFLKKNQRKWMVSRYKDCTKEATTEAGIGMNYPVVFNGCASEKTETRNTMLQRYIACLRGGTCNEAAMDFRR